MGRAMKAQFLLSALRPDEFPHIKTAQGKAMPEIAFVGRSNVGKSSFINALVQTKIAKTSSTPGKTQRINFFSIDDSFLFVDLPGYGFSKAPLAEVQNWSAAIDHYLNARPSLHLLFLLMDIRREPSKEDLMIAQWATAKQISLFLIFTKRDKLSRLAAEQSTQKNLSKMKEIPVLGSLAVSNSNLYERDSLIQRIQSWA
jgi:GTP-binding protein